jgi:outer membrane protein TolC
LPASALTAVDAVDLALCNHPQTREVWASARAQAALVGVAQAAWLPRLDGSAAATRFQYDNGSYNRTSAALTLSWLLYDFGQRSANVENARQLLNAAAATQDATVQSLFLAALQSYYSAQATQAAVLSALEAERSAREGFLAADTRYQVGAGTPADRLQAQTALSQATLNRIRAEGDARNALGTLANALGFEAQQRVVLADMPTMPAELAFQKEIDALIAEAQARRPI